MTGPARRIVLALASLWLAALVLGPFLIALKISVAESVLAQPPYTPLIEDGQVRINWGNYGLLLGDSLYLESYLNSLRLAGTATAVALLIGLPFAYALTKVSDAWRPLALTLAVLPFWTSSLIRIYAWIGILGPEGPVNMALAGLGLIDAPLPVLNTDLGIVSGIVYCYLPFMVLPLYASLVRIDPALVEAAADLGEQCARRVARIGTTAIAPYDHGQAIAAAERLQ